MAPVVPSDLMQSLQWWNRAYFAIQRAKEADFRTVAEVYCRAACIARAQYEIYQAQYKVEVKP